MNNSIRTLQSIIDRNTNQIRSAERSMVDGKRILKFDSPLPYTKEFVKSQIKFDKDFIKRKANEQRVLKKLIKDEIEIANFNRSFDYPTEEEFAMIRELSSATNTPEDSFTDRIF